MATVERRILGALRRGHASQTATPMTDVLYAHR